MGLSAAEGRLRNTGILALILVAGWLAIPDTIVKVWSRFESYAGALVQFDLGRYQIDAVVVVILGVCGWILAGLLKEEE